ncbi:MAG TPA: 30S ribosomal protein S4e [Candidatus Nanoarchaeia archaeon]|nr:30S ribosomal protein S4e [Candidatus Nanoarchaeia archaeon]
MAQHLSRASTPKNWPIKRKETKWITRVNPGTHPLERALNLNILLKDYLKYASTSREVRNILNQGIILVDKKVRKDPKFSIGVMDTIEITKTKEYFRLILDERGNFSLVRIPQSESSLKPCKIINKKILPGKITQINLFDGRNMLSEDKSLKVNDTIILNLESNKIQEHLKFDKNAIIYLISGKKAGHSGKLKEIYSESLSKPRILLDSGKEKIETLKEYAFVINKEFLNHETHNETDKSR